MQTLVKLEVVECGNLIDFNLFQGLFALASSAFQAQLNLTILLRTKGAYKRNSSDPLASLSPVIDDLVPEDDVEGS